MSTTAPQDSFLSALTLAESATTPDTGTTAWPTIPVEDDPTPADTTGFALVSDIADMVRPLPGIETVTGDETGVALTYGRDMSFDFTTGEPAGVATGSLAYVEDNPQALQWIQKCLETPQGQYVIYPARYGSTLRQLTGEGGPDQPLFSEVARTTRACVTAHPRVTDCEILAITRNRLAAETGLFVTVKLTLEDSEQPHVLTLGAST